MDSIAHFSPEEAENKEASAGEANAVNPKDLSDKYGVKLCVRIKPEVYLRLEDEARRKGYTNLSSYIRRLLIYSRK